MTALDFLYSLGEMKENVRSSLVETPTLGAISFFGITTLGVI